MTNNPPNEKIYGGSIGSFFCYAKDYLTGVATALKTKNGALQVDIASGLPSDPATQTTLAAILAKIIAAPATEAELELVKSVLDNIKAKTDNLTSDPATQTTLAAIETLLGGTGKLKDNGPAWTPLKNPGYSANCSSTPLDMATPTSGKTLVMDDIHIGLSTVDAIVSLYEESNATALWTLPLTAGIPFVFTPRNLFSLVTASKKLQLKTNVAAPVYTWCSYHEA
jgi:hypothetical protein